MTNSFQDFDSLRNLTIGTVEFVSPGEIKVLLETDAPQNTAINTGVPTPFPRINGYVLIPNEVGGIVAVINWTQVEYSNFPRRKGFKDFDLIDLPFPLRKMSINPIGTLKQIGDFKKNQYKLERGVYSFPSVGDSVVVPTQEQLKAIVENNDENANIYIGNATIAGDAKVYVDPDKLFGRHLAVLGNTGSGKSCTVAGLVRWSIESAKEKIQELNNSSEKKDHALNTRFIILDPNGEYTNTFNDLSESVARFKINIPEDVEGAFKDLQIPAWLWNSNEWISIAQAAPGTQRPLLMQALAGMKSGSRLENPWSVRLNRFLVGYKTMFESLLVLPPVNMTWGDKLNCGRGMKNCQLDIENRYLPQFTEGDINTSLSSLRDFCETIYAEKAFPWQGTTGFNSFTESELEQVITLLDNVINQIPLTSRVDESPISADSPIPFEINNLPDYLAQLAENESGRDFGQFVSMLGLRLRNLFEDIRLKNVLRPNAEISLEQWLNDYVASSDNSRQITILDLSLIPSDVIHIIIAVFARMTFESLQRYRRMNGSELPTVLIMEEAHTFVHESRVLDSNYSHICLQTFERIAREGRKFGLSMLLSSQRPSELSPTVLSQCNTFILHRLVNDQDQQLVRKLVPDNVGGLLKELPILPTRKAILLGWATPIPVLVEIRQLPKEHTPHSKDPDFWKVWTGQEERLINWKVIADEWQGLTPVDAPSDETSMTTVPGNGSDQSVVTEEIVSTNPHEVQLPAEDATSNPDEDELPF